ncbi:ABC transporter permease subunit [Ancylobacter radicis]|uniref:ABC transporter permease subunit n=1 Tax=Ancylobacter radicis TaxID=2836179 RepID=A0ABS5RBK9_9HYPH|nr:ABC transporter permease subunit [Ancylobacter radicis]MBS9479044.1 ABC transporter permease subunit [Ancylobacter radicis]
MTHSTAQDGSLALPRARPGAPALAAAFILALCAVAGLAGFVSVAPNRLASGQPLPLWVASGPAVTFALVALAGLIAGLALAPRRPDRPLLVALASAMLVLGLVAATGEAATRLVAEGASGGGRLTRVSLGPAFWIWLVVALLVFADATGRIAALKLRFLLVLGLAAGLGGLAASGRLADLSLAREFAVNRDIFVEAVATHLGLTFGGLLLALPAGIAIGAYAAARGRRAGALFAGLNLIQTIPSIALFALLIGPLTALTAALPALRALGLAGIGAFPALIALALYALLPVARAVAAALTAVPPATLEAGRAMGMTRTQLAREVTLPLALPILLEMARVVLVQLIGLTVLAALIGAGGLGTFIFRGLGQTAADLVLLGALATIALALAAHLALGLLIGLARPQGAA